MGCFIYRSKTVRTNKTEIWIWSQQTCTGPLICLTQYSCQKWWTPASQPVYVTSINSHTLPSGWDSMSAKRFPARGREETACYGKHTPFSSFQPEVCMFGQASWETLNHLPDGWKTPAYFEWGRLDHNQLHPCHLSSQSYGWNQPTLPYFMAHQMKIPTLPSSLILLYYKNRSGALVLPTSALFRNSQNARRTAAPPPSTESCKKQSSPSRKSWRCKRKYQSKVNQLAMFSGGNEQLKSDSHPSALISRHLLMQEHSQLNGCLNGEGGWKRMYGGDGVWVRAGQTGEI